MGIEVSDFAFMPAAIECVSRKSRVVYGATGESSELLTVHVGRLKYKPKVNCQLDENIANMDRSRGHKIL